MHCATVPVAAAGGVSGVATIVLLLHLPAVLCRRDACPDTISHGKKVGRVPASSLRNWRDILSLSLD